MIARFSLPLLPSPSFLVFFQHTSQATDNNNSTIQQSTKQQKTGTNRSSSHSVHHRPRFITHGPPSLFALFLYLSLLFSSLLSPSLPTFFTHLHFLFFTLSPSAPFCLTHTRLLLFPSHFSHSLPLTHTHTTHTHTHTRFHKSDSLPPSLLPHPTSHLLS
ncbi:hypothetical protein F5H01DRAFT_112048 [Linnemannia elongata]|nr:hypothetical protein F5H01DRAFT_112048 [Linnemannia elongata]